MEMKAQGSHSTMRGRNETEGHRLAAIPGPNYFPATPVHLYPLMVKS